MSEREVLKRWLQDHGFTENPFALTEAEQESRLGEYFVPGPHFDDIKNRSETTLVFALRGAGKSACRMMIQRRCRPADGKSTVLAIPYVSFDEAVAKLGRGERVTTEDHVSVLLRLGTLTLFEELSRQPDPWVHWSGRQRGRLRWYIEQYAPELLDPVHVAEEWLADEVRPEVRGDNLVAVREQGVALAGQLAATVAVPPAGGGFPRSAFAAFTQLVREVGGVEAVYVLVDGVDEYWATGSGEDACLNLVLPLVADLRLMQTPGTAFKLMLPAQLARPLEQRAAHFKRLTRYDLKWRDKELREMLRDRLLTFSESKVESVGALADKGLARTLDDELVAYAVGSPRRMLVLADMLVRIHCRQAEPLESLSLEDWDEARARFEEVYEPPRLSMIEGRRVVFIGDRQVRLTELEYKLLRFLYEGGGKERARDEIAAQVWDAEEGVSEIAIDSVVSRLRGKIEPNRRRPTYLLTVRGTGFRLAHGDWGE